MIKKKFAVIYFILLLIAFISLFTNLGCNPSASQTVQQVCTTTNGVCNTVNSYCENFNFTPQICEIAFQVCNYANLICSNVTEENAEVVYKELKEVNEILNYYAKSDNAVQAEQNLTKALDEVKAIYASMQ